MIALENRIDIARERVQITSLQEELLGASVSGDPWAVVAYSKVLALSDADGAWNRLREVVSVLGDRGAPSYWAHLGMASIYMSWKVPDQAASEIKAALALYPQSAQALFLRARFSKESGSLPAYRQDLKLAVDKGGAKLAPYACLEWIALTQGDADQSANKALMGELLKEHGELLAVLTRAAELEEDPAKKKAMLSAALSLAPESLRLAKAYALALEAEGDLGAALASWAKVAEAHPNDLDSWRSIARLAAKLDDSAREVSALKKMVELDQGALESLRRLAELQLQNDDLEGADASWTEYLVRKPNDGPALLARGSAREAREALLDALKDYRAADEQGVEGAKDKRESLQTRIGLPDKAIRGSNPDAVYGQVARLVSAAYAKRLVTAPALGGTLSVKVWVEEGKVVLAELKEDTLHDPMLVALAFWLIHDAEFPKTKGRREYTLPFSFEPKS